MVSPTELSRLGVTERLKKLGFQKYILIVGVILFFLLGFEIFRYEQYQHCILENTKFIEQEISKATQQAKEGVTKEGEQKDTPEEQTIKRLQELEAVRHASIMVILNNVDIYANTRCRSIYRFDVFRWFSWLSPITEAYAQIQFRGYSENEIRGMVIISIFACMGIFFFLSTGALLFSKNAKVVAFSMDSVKTLLGFFIGVAMTFMGVR